MPTIAAGGEFDVARVGADAIRSSELDARTAARLADEAAAYDRELRRLTVEHERARHSIAAQELSKLVDERVLALEAQARHVTTTELLAAVPHPPPADAEVKAFYAAHSDQIGAPFVMVEGQIRDQLAKDGEQRALRAFYDELRRKYHAELLLEPQRAAVDAIGPARGPDHAAVTLVEFADFQCPYCIKEEPVLAKIVTQYPNTVR
ncbi:MAG TPA: thioredoxin domain-containing protein, partial [Vicinamibacterales bacterium]|nr:thioredoxin domain-containing protein [Vicinamibacterales bacterium]